MRPWGLLLAPLILALGACDAQVARMGRSAVGVRRDMEHRESADIAMSNARQEQLLAAAEKLEEQKLASDPEEAAKEARYDVRRDGAGYSVYDLNTGTVVRLGAQQQVGLNRDRADEVAYSMQQDENAAQLRAATTSAPGGRR